MLGEFTAKKDHQLLDIYMLLFEFDYKNKSSDTIDDYVTFIALKEGRMDYIESDLGFLISINYLIETCPELFSSSETKNLVVSKLKELDKKGWPFNRDFRRYSRNTEKHLEKKQKS